MKCRFLSALAYWILCGIVLLRFSFSYESRSADFDRLNLTVLPRTLIGSHTLRIVWYHRHATVMTGSAESFDTC